MIAEDSSDGMAEGEAVFASAFGFSIATQGRTTLGYIDSNGDGSQDAGEPVLFDLSTGNAFTGLGSLTMADVDSPEDPENIRVTALANTYNLFGVASAPGFAGSVNNGDSSASIIPVLDENDDETLYHQRSSSASADSLTGTNYPNALAHNEQFGLLGFANVPWWAIYVNPPIITDESDGLYEEIAVGFIGAGGN